MTDSCAVPFTYVNRPFIDDIEFYQNKTTEILTSGQFIMGAELAAFEQEFATFTGAAWGVGVGNGLDALKLALQAADVGEGDQVVVPSHTFIATWLAVYAVGATPVTVPVSKSTYGLEADVVRQYLTPATKAVIGVHLYGHPCDALALRTMCDEKGLWFIEDAAQAHGASISGQAVGSLGHMAAFSFYPTKTLGAVGDGGIVTGTSPELHEKLKLLRNYGSSVKYRHDIVGTNTRLDELQAAFLRRRLEKLPAEHAARNALASLYDQALDNRDLTLPQKVVGIEHAYHLYVVRHPERDRLRDYLATHNIDTVIHYPIACARQPLNADDSLHCDVADEMAATVLSLPMSAFHTPAQLERVIKVVNSF
jgi:dTDP-3-amino-3,4,6-trideoxy-alpha-D-glucose transaminase